MPNDAKLGLLAGVFGVVVAAVLSVQRSPAPTTAAPQPTRTETKAAGKPAEDRRVVVPPAENPDPPPDPPDAVAPASLPTDLASTPVVRTRPEPAATPTGRPKRDGP